MSDIEFLERQVRNLMLQNRALQQGLRDEFAKAALSGYMAGIRAQISPEKQIEIAKGLWSTADAMIETRGGV